MPSDAGTKIYSATYSNVPVYEYNVDGNHVMRRRSDDWINATHILKVADYDKPQRTRILEREVQKGVHEKVQGGYGKYQGTWIPLPDGKALAIKNGIFGKLQAIFDFVPGDRSPPPAPKHTTAASAKPRAPKQTAAQAKQAASRLSHEMYDSAELPVNGDDSDDNATLASQSMIDEDDRYGAYGTGSRKRKRDANDGLTLLDQQHQLWADELLDYFMLRDEQGYGSGSVPPEPPTGINLDRPIDEKGHTALHWAAAMGDVAVARDLIRRGARIDATSEHGETPLMRAVMFTNNFDTNTMPRLAGILQNTVHHRDWFGSTVFHHIAATTSSKSKYACARYYMESILTKISESMSRPAIGDLLNMRDRNGDTAVLLAARYGARKCIRILMGYGADTSIPCQNGETADDLIAELNVRRNARLRAASSSPFQPDTAVFPHQLNGALPSHGHSASQLTLNGLSSPTHRSISAGSHSHLYRSIAAQTLATQLPALLHSRMQKLASVLETEVMEKDEELADAERVITSRRAEVEAVRAQVEVLTRQLRSEYGENENGELIGGSGGYEVLEQRREEEELARLATLMNEAEDITRREQDRLLEDLLSRHLRNAGASVNGNASNADNDVSMAMDSTENNGDGKDKAVLAKLRLAHDLQQAQAKHDALIKDVVEGIAAAGLGERAAEYKRLITAAMGVDTADVENLLPDILRELEEARGFTSALPVSRASGVNANVGAATAAGTAMTVDA